jgi:hypothetical protein
MTWISSASFFGLQVIVHFIDISGIVNNHCFHDMILVTPHEQMIAM